LICNLLAQKNRARFGNGEGRANDGHVDICQFGRVGDRGKRPRADELRRRRAYYFCLREPRADQTVEISAVLQLGEFAAHADERIAKIVQERMRGILEQRHLRNRGAGGWRLCAHRCKDGFAARHCGFLFSTYQLRNV
jgi:hypothetical protein